MKFHKKMLSIPEYIFRMIQKESVETHIPASWIILNAVEQYFARKIAERKEKNENNN